jgi:hypothetical protein
MLGRAAAPPGDPLVGRARRVPGGAERGPVLPRHATGTADHVAREVFADAREAAVRTRVGHGKAPACGVRSSVARAAAIDVARATVVAKAVVAHFAGIDDSVAARTGSERVRFGPGFDVRFARFGFGSFDARLPGLAVTRVAVAPLARRIRFAHLARGIGSAIRRGVVRRLFDVGAVVTTCDHEQTGKTPRE